MGGGKLDEQAHSENGYDRPCNGYAWVQQEEIEMPNMDEDQDLQHPSPNGNARQEEEPGRVRPTRPRFLPPHCTSKKAIIGIVISLGLVLFGSGFGLGTLVPLNCPKDAIRPVPGSCPFGWVGYNESCYKLSEDEKSWNESQNACMLHNASLAKITEKVLMRMFTRDHGLWIGLTRERDQPWKWPDGANATMEVNGNGGDCAFLDMDVTAISLRCSTEHHYVCEKRLLRDPEREREL